jgi:hypothetical protein
MSPVLQTTFGPPSAGPVKGLSNGGSGHCNGWTVHHLDESLSAEHTTGEGPTDLSPRSPRDEEAQVSNPLIICLICTNKPAYFEFIKRYTDLPVGNFS